MPDNSIKITIPAHHFEYNKSKLKEVIRKAGAALVRIDKGLLRQAGTGRLYGKHRASAPGSPAAKITGDLIASVKSRVSKSGTSVIVKEGVFYSTILEVGAKGGGNRIKGKGRSKKKVAQTTRVLLPRPSLQIAMQKLQSDSLKDRFIEALKGSIDFKTGKAPKK